MKDDNDSGIHKKDSSDNIIKKQKINIQNKILKMEMIKMVLMIIIK